MAVNSVCDIYILDLSNDELTKMSLGEATEEASQFYNGEISQEAIKLFVEIQLGTTLVEIDKDMFKDDVDADGYILYLSREMKVVFIPDAFDGKVRQNPLERYVCQGDEND